MLTYEIREAADHGTAAPLIVLMHGRGASRFDLQPLADYMPSYANIVFPEAPHGAAQWGYGPGSAWYRFLGRNKPEPESFSASLDALAELIGSFNATEIVLGGFSQGGAMSMAYALSHPGAIKAVINFSGFLADHPRVAVTRENVANTSFFWGHGRQDSSIPFELAIEGRAAFAAAAADLTARDYDSGHWIEPQELNDAVAWLAKKLSSI